MRRKASLWAKVVIFVVALGSLFSALGTWAGLIREPATSSRMSTLDRWALSTYLDIIRTGDLARPASDDPTPQTFIIEQGESLSRIAQRLQSEGLIRDAELFRLYVRLRGMDSTIRAGRFILRPNMSIPEIAQALQRSTAIEVQVTIPEGWRREELADFLEQQLGISAEEFRALTSRASTYAYPFLKGLPADATLEGYLFPDTYRLPEQPTAQDVILRMLDNFNQKVSPLLEQYQAAGGGWTSHELITLASIVEREAVIAAERPIIASVYFNRLRVGQPLQADPTTQYALGYQASQKTWWKKGLTVEDLRYADPGGYNTYVYPTLPPGPIASPGLASIQAVLQPAQTNYFYFVASCNGDGSHQFSITFAEHQSKLCR
ncbi:MAG: endolytic transglycosylase MltG [Thermoflexales bacterium]